MLTPTPAARHCRLERLEPRRLFATIVVDSTAHVESPFNGDTTLPDAIFKANTTDGPDTIVLQPGATYVLDHIDNTNWGSNGLQSIASEITIEGNGATIMRSTAAGTPDFRIFYVMSADRVEAFFGPGSFDTTPSLTLNNLTLANGQSKGGGGEPGGGGGAGLGGAVYNQSVLSLNNVLITDSVAKGGYGGVRSTAVGDGGDFGDGGVGGGGEGASSATGGNGQTGTFGEGGGKGSTGKGGNGQFGAGGGSTNSSNPANRGIGGFGGGNGNLSGGAGGGGAGLGGAVFNEGGILLVHNSTLYGNLADGGNGHQVGRGWGGAIFSLNGNVTLRNATIAENAADAGGGIFLAGSQGGHASLTAFNSIVANSSAASDLAGTGATQFAGGRNIVRFTEGVALPADYLFSSADPILGALIDNGGPTRTVAILNGSPAVDSGDNDQIPPGATTDQRGPGFARVRNGTVDIGAFELPNPTNPSTFSVDDASVVEGNSGTRLIRFNLTRGGDTSGYAFVRAATQDGTAVSPGDFTPGFSDYTFVPGQTRGGEFQVEVRGDVEVEPDEILRLVLSEPRGGTIADGEGIGTIVNDDSPGTEPPTVSISDASTTEGNSGTKLLTFTLTRSGNTSGASSVLWQTRNLTAGEGDYGVASGTVSFAAGETSKTISIVIKGDTKVEGDEQFLIVLTGETNATLARISATGTIINDDGTTPPSLRIGDASTTEGDGGTKQLLFTVTLDKPWGQTVTVGYRTRNSTAGEGDYGVTSGTLTFAPGQTSRTIGITIKGDTKVEVDERFIVDLTQPVNATLGDAVGVGTILNDD